MKNMHSYTTIYITLWIIVFSHDIYTTLMLSLFNIMLQWFYFAATLGKTHREPYQFCVLCRKMTPQHYVHCKDCVQCVPIDFIHSRLLNTCSLEFHVQRYKYLVYITNAYLTIVLLLYSFSTAYYIGLFFHFIAIYSMYREKNINTA